MHYTYNAYIMLAPIGCFYSDYVEKPKACASNVTGIYAGKAFPIMP